MLDAGAAAPLGAAATAHLRAVPTSLGAPTGAARLRDGTRVRIRPLEPGDRDALLAGFEALSERSRYLRFASPKPRLTRRELDYLVLVDHLRHEALAAVGPDGAGVGVARYVALDDPGTEADVAVTVADAWQRRGAGAVLLDALAARAAAAGVRRLSASVLPENRPALRLLRRHGFVSAGREEGLWRFVRDLEPVPAPGGFVLTAAA